MEIRFKDESLDSLETDPQATGGFPEAIVTAFRKRVQFIRSAKDERDFYQMRSLRFEKTQRCSISSTLHAAERSMEIDFRI